MSRYFIIDCDTAEDDITSLFMLLRYGINVEGVTIVEGNISFDQEVNNALWALEFINRSDIPVYPGSRKPIVKSYRTVENVHGKGGIGDIIPKPKFLKAQNKHAVDAIIDLADRYQGELEFLAISPLTNLALAYLKDNSIADKIKKVWIMGGTIFGRGNITPVAEYNFWVDPDAAKIIFNSGMDLTMVSWDLITNYTIDEKEWEHIKQMNTKMSNFYISIYEHYRKFAMQYQKMNGNPHPDVITTSIAIDPSVATKVEKQYVDIENCDCLTRGMTVIDYLGVLGKNPNTNVVYEIDKQKFLSMLYSLLSWF
ncbi:nucleoside hydrolase [Acidianus sulfidivorans JP7]|uniref:Nucleoside hydrolase n=1 Tax=Acidianus sulfidivorans JP7 TaxID=619593 RepID=A0A2U9IMU9_9CREN|nr:nucleoside hydrolase [Acidianus sulfidivorans]AWR97389.1 nucleoside hydrolase [Acidianus sulfidivorans JP7]